MSKRWMRSIILIICLMFIVTPFSKSAGMVIHAQQAPENLPVIGVHASNHDGNFPENTLDNDLNTRWSAQGVGEWIQYDLGSLQQVGYLGIAFHNGTLRLTTVDIEVSADGVEWIKVVDHATNSGSTFNLEPYDFNDITARYVKIIGYGNSVNTWNSITAVHIYPPNPDGPIVAHLEAIDPGPVPGAEPFTKPGLYNPDGSPHPIHEPNQVTGRTLNVLDFGANPADNNTDDLPAIAAALEEARFGDEVYFPNGVYNLISQMPTDGTSHLHLKSGVNLRGESQTGTILKSYFDAQDAPNSKVLTGYARHHIVISNITITSTYEGDFSSNPDQNNPDRGGPAYVIYLSDMAGSPSHHITMEHVTIEKFQRMGVRIDRSHDIVVQNSTFQKATDVGGGGAGYGVAIQGVVGINRLGHANDSHFNVVQNNRFEGPYLRHGVLVQYYSHNNLIANNTFRRVIHDAIDLHGQREYLNEITGNTLENITRGGIGVGNTGGTPPHNHSASGAGNYIHLNTLTNTRDGITVIMGSPDTVIEKNTIVNTMTPAHSKGIYLLNAPRTVVRENVIQNNTAQGFWGIHLAEDLGDRNNHNNGAGLPEDILITGNRIQGNTNGILIEAGKRIRVEQNEISGNIEEDYINLIEETEDPDPETPVIIETLSPTDDALIDIEKPNANYGSLNQELIDSGAPDQNYYKFFNIKRNAIGSKGRIAYYKFPVEQISGLQRAVFELTGKLGSNTQRVELEVYGLTHDDWDENTITWNQSMNHLPDSVDVTGIGETAFFLGTFTVEHPTETPYQVDITDFVQQQTNGYVTLMVIDRLGQNGNINLYSKEESNAGRRPALLLEKVQAIEPPLLLSNVSFHDYRGKDARADSRLGLMRGMLDIENRGHMEVHASLIAELYAPDGTLHTEQSMEVQIEGKERETIEIDMIVPRKSKGYYVKLYVKSLTLESLLSNELEYTIKQRKNG